jgi:hypothetical protein
MFRSCNTSIDVSLKENERLSESGRVKNPRSVTTNHYPTWFGLSKMSFANYGVLEMKCRY